MTRLPGMFLCLFVFSATALAPSNAFSSISPPSATKAPLFEAHSTPKSRKSVSLTYLEVNGWLMTIGGVTVLIDPILDGALDFGIPALFEGKKRILPLEGLTKNLPPIDCVLITQGLDDHAHVRTLKQLQQLDPNVPIVAPPSAKGALQASGFYSDDKNDNVQFIKHRETIDIRRRQSSSSNNEDAVVQVRATQGALVGPPWQTRENGYVLKSSKSPSIYIEPHVEFNAQELSQLGPVDIVVTPISGEGLPAFELVHGPTETLRLVKTLRPKYIVPMQNGDIDSDGLLASLVSKVGSPTEFKQKFADAGIDSVLVKVTPGEVIELSL